MIIKFRRVKIHNFLSIGDAEVNLENNGYVLISGINKKISDNAKSNGSGKTTIAEAILWALTGDTFRGFKNVVNRNTTGGAVVELLFKVDNKEYKIVRYKEHEDFGNNLKIFIDERDMSGKGIRDGEALLKQYLPDLSTQLIGSVIILGQGLPQRFSNNTPSGRKEILEKLSKSDFMIEDIKSKLNNRKSVLNTQLRAVEDKILKATTQKELLERQLKETEEQLFLTPDSETLESKINSLNSQLEDINVLISDHQKNINDIKPILDKVKVELKDLNSSKDEALEKVNKDYNCWINQFKEDQFRISSEISSLNSEIFKLESIKDICPTCHQPLPGVIKPDTTEQRKKVEELNTQLIVTNNKLNNIQLEYQRQYGEVKSNFTQSISNLENQERETSIQIDRISQGIDLLEHNKSNLTIELNKVNSEKENLNNLKISLNNKVSELKESLNILEQEILYNDKDKQLIDERLATVSKMFTVATREFRGFLLTNIINFINHKVKEYSVEVFGHDRIEFGLEGNNINISFDGIQLEGLSGGERQKIDIIIQLALRDMLVQHLNFDSNILFVDEIFDNLDAIGCEKILDLISKKSTSIESLFIITHHSSELSIPYDNEIIVEKNEKGISYIK